MIHEVDEALRALIRDEALRGTDIEVAFEAPTKDWAARRNAPTVNLYLYDIREDLRRKSRGMVNEYDLDTKQVVARHLPPRYIKLSYLLTAWTQRPEDEHRLLSLLLLGFIKYESVPKHVLTGSIAEYGMPIPMTVALPPPEDRAFADVWTALGGELKPSLDLVVSTPIAGDSFVAAATAKAGVKLSAEGDEPVHHAPVEGADDEEEPRVAMRRERKVP